MGFRTSYLRPRLFKTCSRVCGIAQTISRNTFPKFLRLAPCSMCEICFSVRHMYGRNGFMSSQWKLQVLHWRLMLCTNRSLRTLLVLCRFTLTVTVLLLLTHFSSWGTCDCASSGGLLVNNPHIDFTCVMHVPHRRDERRAAKMRFQSRALSTHRQGNLVDLQARRVKLEANAGITLCLNAQCLNPAKKACVFKMCKGCCISARNAADGGGQVCDAHSRKCKSK